MMTVFGKLLHQWKACGTPSTMLPGFRETATHSKAMIDWDGSWRSGLCYNSATLKVWNPTSQLS